MIKFTILKYTLGPQAETVEAFAPALPPIGAYISYRERFTGTVRDITFAWEDDKPCRIEVAIK